MASAIRKLYHLSKSTAVAIPRSSQPRIKKLRLKSSLGQIRWDDPEGLSDTQSQTMTINARRFFSTNPICVIYFFMKKVKMENKNASMH